MEWTNDNYPPEMKDLDPKVRIKAIEIANRLIEEKQANELYLIKLAISQAKEWFLDMEG